MEPSTAPSRTAKVPVRLLCLGNDLMADDAVGHLAAHELRRFVSDEVEVVESSLTGLDLLDLILDARRLVVIDAIVTERAEPGTVHFLTEDDVESAHGASPHYTGLFEALTLGRGLHLAVADEVVLVAVEAADVTTVGGAVDPAVQAALPEVLRLVKKIIGSPSKRTAKAGSLPAGNRLRGWDRNLPGVVFR